MQLEAYLIRRFDNYNIKKVEAINLINYLINIKKLFNQNLIEEIEHLSFQFNFNFIYFLNFVKKNKIDYFLNLHQKLSFDF